MPRKTPPANDLALAHIPKPPPLENIRVKLPKPLLANLQLYAEAYKDKRGEGIDQDTLLTLILEGHLAKDRAFADWLSKNNKSLAR